MRIAIVALVSGLFGFFGQNRLHGNGFGRLGVAAYDLKGSVCHNFTIVDGASSNCKTNTEI